jgi:hypothetical protein
MAETVTKISNDRLRDLLKFVVEFNPDEARIVLVAMKATLGVVGVGAVLTDNDVYRVPESHKLAILGIRGHLASLLVASEVAPAGLVNGVNYAVTMDAVQRAKAMNCRVKLSNLDTSLLVTDSTDDTISLSSILVEAGGKEIDLRETPHIIRGGQSLRMDVTLISNAATAAGQNAEYGILMTGLLVRTKGDV